MGIRNLNRFLIDNTSHHSIRKVGLQLFENKIVAIDTSIYLYKFIEKNALIENMYLLITILRKYNIVPLFIFDGKPPKEKKELLEKRRLEKKEAEKKFNELKSQLVDGDINEDIVAEMEILKKKFIRLKDTDIASAKHLMDAYGVHYIESCGEADQLCAYLVKYNYASACISDDMDMFLYGCPQVLRHLSLLNHTAIMYDTKEILNNLDLTQNEFNQIMILSGTDYNIQNNKSLTETMQQFRKYREKKSYKNFYSWLIAEEYYTQEYIQNMNNINNMFDLSMFILLNNVLIHTIINNMPFRNGYVDKNRLNTMLAEDGFVFIQ
jgi:hypothetical protein